MEKRTASLLGMLALVGLVAGAVVLLRRGALMSEYPPAPTESSYAPATTPPPPLAEEDASPSHGDTSQALADLTEDDYTHKAFVAVGPGDVTVWKDRSATFRTATGTELCVRCLTTDFVATRDHVAWVELLETHLPGFNSTVRAFSTTSGWKRSDAGSPLSWGDRAASLNNGSSIATDGTSVYVVEGKEDAAGNGYGQSAVRVDLAKSTKTLLAKTPASIRNLVFASGELFVTWATTMSPVWRVQAIGTKSGAIRDVVSLPFALPEQTASSTDLYFFYRDAFERTSRGHLASVALAGGAITAIYDTGPNELIGHFAADDSGLYVVRFIGHWVLTRFAKGAAPHDLAQFDAMPRAIAPRKADIAVAFLDELRLVPK